MSVVSAVIPAWMEGARVADAVRAARAVADEVIVSDGGSTDGTAERARDAGARVVTAPKGRGPQLHAGAMAAAGDVLLFLHADVALERGARGAIDRALTDPAVVGGNFFLRFEPDVGWARVFTVANDLRRRALRIYYGDSALFVRRAVYHALGGFRALPIMEDYEFIRRLERAGRTAYLRDVAARASARRFERRPLRTLAVWAAVQSLYSLGAPPARLARLYEDAR
ncbi:MAG: TIGR04283 family arsenosugar biosynthesis glycosyltransferase [Polyangiales bacterium]